MDATGDPSSCTRGVFGAPVPHTISPRVALISLSCSGRTIVDQAFKMVADSSSNHSVSLARHLAGVVVQYSCVIAISGVLIRSREIDRGSHPAIPAIASVGCRTYMITIPPIGVHASIRAPKSRTSAASHDGSGTHAPGTAPRLDDRSHRNFKNRTLTLPVRHLAPSRRSSAGKETRTRPHSMSCNDGRYEVIGDWEMTGMPQSESNELARLSLLSHILTTVPAINTGTHHAQSYPLS